MEKIQINLPENSYPIIIGENILLSEIKKIFEKRVSCCFLITNSTIQNLYGELIRELTEELNSAVFILNDGEEYKNLESLRSIYDFLISQGAIRSDVLIAFGGGVIGDLVGHAAATYMRGLDYIQVPTTLLAQVDSSIGGKTGVNHLKTKNIIGSFKHPIASLLDISFLKTLPARQLTAGYAEIFKHSLIRDRTLYDSLISQNPANFFENFKSPEELIYRSCLIKGAVVEADENEQNLRAILNFGHTIGHMLETVTDYTKYLHGEAILCGMDFAARRSFRKGYIFETDYTQIYTHLKATGVSVEIPAIGKEDFLHILGKDKKKESSGIRFVSLCKIGEAFVEERLSLDSLWEDFSEYLQSAQPLIRQKK